MKDFPPELKLHVFSFLTQRDLGQASAVCWEWDSLTKDDSLPGKFKIYDKKGVAINCHEAEPISAFYPNYRLIDHPIIYILQYSDINFAIIEERIKNVYYFRQLGFHTTANKAIPYLLSKEPQEIVNKLHKEFIMGSFVDVSSKKIQRLEEIIKKRLSFDINNQNFMQLLIDNLFKAASIELDEDPSFNAIPSSLHNVITHTLRELSPKPDETLTLRKG